MNENQKNLTTQVNEFLRGDYDAADHDTQCKSGWYDWFCKDKALAAKTQKLYNFILKIYKSKKFDPQNVYVFLKNNCPTQGLLYDDFRICDLKTGNVLFNVSLKDSHENNKARVFDIKNGFDKPVVVGTPGDVVKWFLS